METISKKVKHWPGPWSFDETPDGRQDTVIELDGCPLCTVRGTDDMFCIDEEDVSEIAAECVANAKLIAAAPELLKALNDLSHQVIRDCSISTDPKYLDLCMRVQDALQAIKKATE